MGGPPPQRLTDTRTLRQLARAIDGVVEGTSYGTTAYHYRGALLARVLPDGDSVVIKTERIDRKQLISQHPDKYSVTPHYQAYPWMIVRLAAVTREELAEALARGVRYCQARRRARGCP